MTYDIGMVDNTEQQWAASLAKDVWELEYGLERTERQRALLAELDPPNVPVLDGADAEQRRAELHGQRMSAAENDLYDQVLGDRVFHYGNFVYFLAQALVAVPGDERHHLREVLEKTHNELAKVSRRTPSPLDTELELAIFDLAHDLRKLAKRKMDVAQRRAERFAAACPTGQTTHGAVCYLGLAFIARTGGVDLDLATVRQNIQRGRPALDGVSVSKRPAAGNSMAAQHPENDAAIKHLPRSPGPQLVTDLLVGYGGVRRWTDRRPLGSSFGETKRYRGPAIKPDGTPVDRDGR